MIVADELTSRLIGRYLTSTERREYDWAFGFRDDVDVRCGLRVNGPWRIFADNHIAFTSSDDGQTFGLPMPFDALEVVPRLLGKRAIKRVSIRAETGDISIIFDEDRTLEVFNMSCGYESWEIGAGGMYVIGTGGGRTRHLLE